MGENSSACWQKCLYNTMVLPTTDVISSGGAVTWMVTTSTLLRALETPGHHLHGRRAGGGLPALGQAPVAVQARSPVAISLGCSSGD